MHILVIDPFPEEVETRLRELSSRVTFLPQARPEEARAALAEAEILLINSKINLDARTLATAPKLRLVCRAGVGLDHFDLPEMERRGIRWVNAPGQNARPVGEQALGMLLSLMHNICRANAEVSRFAWNREANRGTELSGRTVGIIGYGNTGSAFARTLRGFGCRVLAHDKYKSGFSDEWVTEASLDKVKQEAEVISFHVPLTEETHYYADTRFFADLANPVWFLNLARGPVTQTSALIEALESGKVIAAGLDVLENEKMQELSPEQRGWMEKLIAHPRVLLTPHIGGWSHESLKRINDLMLEAIAEEIKK